MNGHELAKNTLDEIITPNSDAKKIVGLVRERGKITGYKLSDNSFVTKQDAINMTKNGGISGVGVAHRGNTVYLKAIPNGNGNDNLSNLPSYSPQR